MNAVKGMRHRIILTAILMLSFIVSCEKQGIELEHIKDHSGIFTGTAAQNSMVTYFSETFTITSKNGLIARRSMENPDFSNFENFVISVKNGKSGKTKVTRMEISLDGKVIITYRDFKKNANSVSRHIPEINSSSILKIKLEGSQGRFIIVTITASLKVSSLTDIEGNIYRTVRIGDQWWMAENLKTTKYNDGTAIPWVKENSDWLSIASDYLPAFSWYDNNSGNKNIYGALYNWAAAGNDKLCPAGWHVPESDEFLELCLYVDPDAVIGFYSEIAGGALKEEGMEHWASPNAGATDAVGFTALPGGNRNVLGEFADLGYSGTWWSDKGLSSCSMSNDNTYASFSEGGNEYGRSVRCIKD